MKRFTLFMMVCLALNLAQASQVAEPFATAAAPFLKTHCIRCHGPKKAEGKLRFDELSDITAADINQWNSMKEMIQFEDMPPEDEPQPTAAERRNFLDWITLRAATIKGVLDDQQALYDSTRGNAVDHQRLFDGSITGLASSPPRFWRRSQPQYDSLMEKLWVIPKLRYDESRSRTDVKHAKYGYSQPFPQMDPAHFTNYSGGVHGDEAMLRSLMDAGSQMAIRMTVDKPDHNGDIQPLERLRIPLRKLPKDSPLRNFVLDAPQRPAAFEPFFSENAKPTVEQQQAAIQSIFKTLLDREPSAEELKRFGSLTAKMVEKRGSLAGLRGLITAVFISPEFVFRMELGMGEKDEHGRRMLSPQELVYAIGYAISDDGPDAKLLEAAKNGKLATRADVEREVRRILADNSIEKHRRLRFFQEFFGYTQAPDVFKDARGWSNWATLLVRDADMLVEYMVEKDRNVLAELLATDRYFVAYPNYDDPAMLNVMIELQNQKAEEGIKKMKSQGKDPLKPRGGPYRYDRARTFAKGLNLIPPLSNRDNSAGSDYILVYGYLYETFDWPREQPVKTPKPRAGILTHPAWLVAHSQNFDNYVVGRGHWIRENLLAGKVPDVPIDVDAQLPDEPTTLRERMRVTRADYCWKCHKKMDPLGFPFEMYDHYGVHRDLELTGENRKEFHHTIREDRGRPIDTSGEIIESGEPSLDGKVTNAIDLVQKLAKSERVRQSFVRHAFRYWMGRNEMLNDSSTLIAADKAYVEHNGSFNELLVSLLTSDSFLYRK